MSEEDVRGGLREAVADEPPLDFDPDALVATARQQVKRRRALLAVGVATVVVAVAAVALPGALGRQSTRVGSSAPESPASSVTSPRPTPFEWPPAGVPLAHYTPDELAVRGEQMASHLKDSMPATLPEASDFVFGEFGGEAAGHYYENQTSVNASISFTIGGARYSIVVTVWVPGTDNPSPTTLCEAGGDAGCTQLGQIGQGDGGPLFATTIDLDSGGTITTAYHFRQTGTMVQIGAYNYDVASSGTVTYLPTMPVTLEQLMRLATDPELAL